MLMIGLALFELDYRESIHEASFDGRLRGNGSYAW